MSWKFTSDTPIYIQIMDEIKLRIAQGKLNPGDKVLPVRELAVKAGVNPNTMQKALSELEREGILVSHRTSGRFVAELPQGEKDMKDGISLKCIQTYINGMRELGYSDEDLVSKLKNYLSGEDK